MTQESGDWRSRKGLEYESFEWSEEKRETNLAKHGIDFVDAAKALLEPHIAQPVSRMGEQRSIAIAGTASQTIAIIYTVRGQSCRIISARIARRAERKAYQALLRRRNPKASGED